MTTLICKFVKEYFLLTHGCPMNLKVMMINCQSNITSKQIYLLIDNLKSSDSAETQRLFWKCSGNVGSK